MRTRAQRHTDAGKDANTALRLLLLAQRRTNREVSHKEEPTWQYSLNADQPRPVLKSNYERFNCNNFKIRY